MKKNTVKWLIIGVILGLSTSCRRDGSWLLKAKATDNSGAPGASKIQPGEPDRESTATDCRPGGPATVIYDKGSDQLRFCDNGAWTLLSKEEFRALNQGQGADRKHPLDNSFSASPLDAASNGVLSAKMDVPTETDPHVVSSKENPENPSAALDNCPQKPEEKSYFCRAIPTGSRKSFQCKRAK